VLTRESTANPVYSHFADKGAIIDAVAVEGRRAGSALRSAAAGGLGAVARAYLDFAGNQPAL
jgi:hypothetical protein